MSVSWDDSGFSTEVVVPLDDSDIPTSVIIGAIDSNVTAGVYTIKVKARILGYNIKDEYYINVTIVDICPSTVLTID